MMKHKSLALAMSFLAVSAVSAVNAATLSGVSVTNTATITGYSVGGVAQTTPINSNTTTFLVDRIVNVTVTGSSTPVLVAQSATGRVLTFNVTNNSNSDSDFKLEAQNASGDDFDIDVTKLKVYVDAVAGDGGYNAAVDTATFINELAPDTSKKVYVVADIPSTVTNDQLSNIVLVATSHMQIDATTGAYEASAGLAASAAIGTDGEVDSPTKVQTVLADIQGLVDGPRDAAHSAQAAYKVSAASLKLDEAVTTMWDQFNIVTNPKAIPGAVVKYCVRVINEGAMAANGVKVEAPLPANTEWYGTSVHATLVPGVTTGDGSVCGTTPHATSKGVYEVATTTIKAENLDLVPGTVAAPAYQWIQFYVLIK